MFPLYALFDQRDVPAASGRSYLEHNSGVTRIRHSWFYLKPAYISHLHWSTVGLLLAAKHQKRDRPASHRFLISGHLLDFARNDETQRATTGRSRKEYVGCIYHL